MGDLPVGSSATDGSSYLATLSLISCPPQTVVVGCKGKAPEKSKGSVNRSGPCCHCSGAGSSRAFLSQIWAPMEAGSATETFRAVTRSDLKAGSGSPWGVGGWPDALASGEPRLS